MSAIELAVTAAQARNSTRWAARICTLCGVAPVGTRDGWCAQCSGSVGRVYSAMHPPRSPRERTLLDAAADFGCCGGDINDGIQHHRANCYALREE